MRMAQETEVLKGKSGGDALYKCYPQNILWRNGFFVRDSGH